MKHLAKVPGSAIVWADRRRLRPFYQAGKLLPFLAQSPHLAVMATVQTAVTGRAMLVGDAGSLGKGQGGGLALALKRIDAWELSAGRIILIDAAACFLTPATVRAMLQRLATADFVTLRGNGAALAMTSSVLAWLRQSSPLRSAVDLADLARIIQFGRQDSHWRIATLSAFGVGEQPLRDVASIFAGARDARTATALRLVEAGLGLRDPGQIELRGNITFGRNVFIDVNAIIIGEVVLEEGVTIGPNCILENVRIKAGSTVKEFSLVAGALVGPGCRTGAERTGRESGTKHSSALV